MPGSGMFLWQQSGVNYCCLSSQIPALLQGSSPPLLCSPARMRSLLDLWHFCFTRDLQLFISLSPLSCPLSCERCKKYGLLDLGVVFCPGGVLDGSFNSGTRGEGKNPPRYTVMSVGPLRLSILRSKSTFPRCSEGVTITPWACHALSGASSLGGDARVGPSSPVTEGNGSLCPGPGWGQTPQPSCSSWLKIIDVPSPCLVRLMEKLLM